jgi:iron complex outermembrane receptor protein
MKHVLFVVDASVFSYNLQNAISRRIDANANEFFINAGGTIQWGFELATTGILVKPAQHGMVRGVQLRNSFTLNKFSFKNYQNGNLIHSGRDLPGVPKTTVVSSLNISLPSELVLFLQHNYTSGIPLNDLNTVYSPHFNLVQLKLSWKHQYSIKNIIDFYVHADNLLNENYSLGNDLNSPGGRYYNPAALRGFFAGVRAHF